LLLEPQRTNIFQYSEQVDNAYWSKIGSLTITANTNVSPDGYQNADLVTAAAASVRLQRAFSGLTAGTRTLSCFVKAGTGTLFTINAYDGIVDKGAGFNLSTGAVVSTSAGVTATITNYGNGWYRLTHNYTSAGTSYSCQFYFDTVGTYQVYGFQFEDSAAYATSYIPTLGASVTRVADAASKTGISSLIGTEFTIFYDGFETTGGASTRYIGLKGAGGIYNNLLLFEGSAGNTIAVTFLDNSATNVINFFSPSLTNGQRFKLALRCKNNSFAFYVNGSLVASQASGSVPTTSDLYLGYYTDYSDNYTLVNQAIIFPTGLTNAQLAELTA
jgi:hypothetical protein